MSATCALLLLACLLAAAGPGAYLRAQAAARLVPTPLVLGLRRRDLASGAAGRAARLGMSAPAQAAFAIGLAVACAVVWQRPDAAAALFTAWALSLAALCDRRFGTLPPFLSFAACLGGIAALSIDEFGGGGLHGGIADIASAALLALAIELAVRAQARTSGRRVLGPGDPPLLFALFAWAGPVGGSLAFVAALLLVLAGALIGGRRTGAHAPLGVALAAVTMPFVLLPAGTRHLVDGAVVWLAN